MKCRQVIEVLDSLIKEELSKEINDKVQHHVASCSACREELYQLQSMYRLLSFQEEIKAPESFTRNVMSQVAKLRKKEQNKASLYRAWGKSFIAAALIMLMLNRVGLHMHLDYQKLSDKTNIFQRSIILSVDKTSKSIQQLLDNID